MFVEVSGNLIDNSYEVAGGIDKLIGKIDSFVDSARKLGLKTKEQVVGFTQFSKRVLGNEIGSIGKIDDMIDAARRGAVKVDDAIISTPNKLDDLKRVVENPLANTKYTSKVEGQMANQVDWHHSFPKSVDGFAGVGKKATITGGDGITRTKIELPGSLKGQDGHFEWIIEANNKVNHRKFIPKD